jgi:hypothetical protein
VEVIVGAGGRIEDDIDNGEGGEGIFIEFEAPTPGAPVEVDKKCNSPSVKLFNPKP